MTSLSLYRIIEDVDRSGADKPKRKRAKTSTGMVTTTISLPGPMHARLRKLAVDEHTVFTELVRQALREWLERRAKR